MEGLASPERCCVVDYLDSEKRLYDFLQHLVTSFKEKQTRLFLARPRSLNMLGLLGQSFQKCAT